MVEPEVFFMNPQTASSNHYQVDDDSISTDEILKQAKEEFNAFKNAHFTTIKKLSLESRESLQDEKDQDEFRKIKNWKRSEVIKDFKFYIISLNQYQGRICLFHMSNFLVICVQKENLSFA